MARVWSEFDLVREREAEAIRAQAVGMFQAAAAVIGQKQGIKQFDKWLKDLG